MKINMKQTVYDAAIERIEYLFEQFETVYVSFSGGKDSTVVLNLTLEVAERLGRLPVKVFFLDQEAEWQAVIDYVTTIMYDPRVEPYWLQVPFKLTNSTSETENYLNCWDPDKEAVWMRPKDPVAIKENTFNETRFHMMFHAIMATWHPDEKACMIGGVRTEESPARYQALTTNPKYQHVTWGKRLNKDKYPHWTFYPIYDWGYRDVWKYIHEKGADYCKIYDYFYQHGVNVRDMRVSSLHHQTAVRSLYYLQEIEQETWDKMVRRIGGIHVTRNMQMGEMFQTVKKLPWMFRSWAEYRDHLLDKLITNDEWKVKYRERFARDDAFYNLMTNPDRIVKVHIVTILANDTDFTKLNDFYVQPRVREYTKWRKGGKVKREYAQWIPEEYYDEIDWVKGR